MAQMSASKMAFQSQKAIKADLHKVLKTSAIDHLFKGSKENSLASGVEGAIETELLKANAALSAAAPPATIPSAVYPAMTVKEFMQGDYVEPGDVVLMTRLGSFFAWLMRTFDKSDFAHAAMVFQTPRQTDGIDETFLIETSMSGVEIVSLSQFLEPKQVYRDTGLPPDFVVGVKRFEPEWATSLHRRIAAARMLHFIQNDEYNFRLLAALASPKTRSFYFKLQDSLRGQAPAIGDFLKKSNGYLPRQFICSGFVQYAFVDMLKASYERGLIDKANAEKILVDVIFSPNATIKSEVEELLACTPNFLASTPNLQWKYLIHGGDVFHVSSTADVERFFRDTLPGRITEQNGA